jgi:hypothetical protein
MRTVVPVAVKGRRVPATVAVADFRTCGRRGRFLAGPATGIGRGTPAPLMKRGWDREVQV